MNPHNRSELREMLHQTADWVADYLEQVEQRPVMAQVAPGEIAARLPLSAPQKGEPLEQVLEDVDRLLLPGITHWNHPSFFAYFAITGSGPGILGELVTAALNVNAMIWRTSPSATELEQRVLAWTAELLGLPRDWFGEITDTASSSTLYALAAARESADLDIRNQGLAGRSDLSPLVIYTSSQAHSSVDKAASVLGIGLCNVRHIEVDNAFRMRVDLLEQAITHDRERGLVPLAVVATVGTTSSTSIDPVRSIANVCERHKLWLHVDAAYGGAAAMVPSHRSILDGCEKADSFVVNPHKWMLTPVDCSLLYTRRPEALKQAFSLVADYLKTDEAEVVNLMDYGLSLGRRFRSLKLWWVIRAYGSEGLAKILENHLDLAQWLANEIAGVPDWEILAPVPFSTVCFRHAPANAKDLETHNKEIVDRINASGKAFISSTNLRGQFSIRVAIGNLGTERKHVAALWAQLQEIASAG